MTSIVFERTGNVYVNAGIVGLAVMLDWLERDLLPELFRPGEPPLPAYTFELTARRLTVESDDLCILLERVYQLMGRRYYDTSTSDALSKKENFFYLPEADRFVPFPKMKTYGFGALLTNDAAGKTPNPDNTIRRKSIKADDEFGQKLIKRYEEKFEAEGLKLGQQLYVNEPYAKITRLSVSPPDFAPGKYRCPVTGESYKKLQSATNVNAFTSGIGNFLSGISSKSDKIGFRPLYAIRFAPVLALYRYANGLDTLYCYFYDLPSLADIKDVFTALRARLYLDGPEKQAINHLNNIKLAELSLGGKAESKIKNKDFVHPSEILFLLIYTITQGVYGESMTDREGFLRDPSDEDGLQLYMLRADKFSGTMRPNRFVAFNHFAYVRRYIIAAEKYGIDWPQVLASLKVNDPRDKDYQKERLLRDAILERLMTGRPFLEEMARLYRRTATLITSEGYAGYKRWSQLSKLIAFNEFGPLNNYSIMDKALRERAYKLGTQIGMAIRDHETEEGQDPLKFGRKYVIDLDKSRTEEDFLEAIKRAQLRYQFQPSRELLVELMEPENFRTVKLLTVIGALNVITQRRSKEAKSESNKA